MKRPILVGNILSFFVHKNKKTYIFCSVTGLFLMVLIPKKPFCSLKRHIKGVLGLNQLLKLVICSVLVCYDRPIRLN